MRMKYFWRSSLHRTAESGGTKAASFWANSPVLMPFRADFDFPASDVGPWLLDPFSLATFALSSLDMVFSLEMGKAPVISPGEGRGPGPSILFLF